MSVFSLKPHCRTAGAAAAVRGHSSVQGAAVYKVTSLSQKVRSQTVHRSEGLTLFSEDEETEEAE